MVKPEAHIILKEPETPVTTSGEFEHCKDGLARYKYPRWFHFVEDLPKQLPVKFNASNCVPKTKRQTELNEKEPQMPKVLTEQQIKFYHEKGYLAPFEGIDAHAAAAMCEDLEAFERDEGMPASKLS